MYSLYRQLHPPTGIDHCLYCRFANPDEENLVIAGVNQIHVYRLNEDLEVSVKPRDDKAGEKSQDAKAKKCRLECIASYQLFGNIMSMASVRLAGSQTDALVISIKDAKLSIIEYDPSTHDVKTSSMHYFENDDLKDGFIQHSCHIPYLRIDPEGRCAAMLVYRSRLVILPFRKDTLPVDESGSGIPGPGKNPVMASYIIDLRSLDEKITNVVDVQFLHGYYEPTVLLLYEPLPTWTGRVAVRKDSCSIVAISLNIEEHVHPIIWSLSNLPYDSLQAIPVPKPIGGILVFAMNSLIYLNQSFPPYGVSLNSTTQISTDFLLKSQAGVKITLDRAQATFISFDKMVISLRGGELYVLTLLIDSMKAVRSFNLDKAAASVLTTCMCPCKEGYLFLGSRLGNSLLLKYTEKSIEMLGEEIKVKPVTEENKEAVQEEPAPKKRKDDLGDWMAKDVSEIDDLELEVYGAAETQVTGFQITQYTFEVCDSIMNIGPCTHTVMGEPAFLSEEFSNSLDPDLELVTTSGYGKNGAISVLQRTIRPQVVTTFELPGCIDMWTVVGDPVNKLIKTTTPTTTDAEVESTEQGDEDSKQVEELENAHALLILSRENSSLILQTGQEIMELDHSGFITQGPTLYAGNIGNNKYIIQVSPLGVRLLEGVNQIQHRVLDVGSPIVCCSVADPHVVLLSEDGQLVLLTLKYDAHGTTSARLSMSRPQLQQGSKIITLCAYKDCSGMFTTEGGKHQPIVQSEKPKPDVTDVPKTFLDDEDELLYGSDARQSAPQRMMNGSKMNTETETRNSGKEVPVTYWTAVARENGILEIYSLPDLKLCFTVKNFAMGQKILVDTTQQAEHGPKTGTSFNTEKLLANQADDMPVVKELLLVGLANRSSRPHLMARAEEELYIYEAFRYFGSGSDSQLKIRFRKIPHGLIIKERRATKAKKRAASPPDENKVTADTVRWLRPFSDICGYSGVFVCGPYPHWLFMTSRGLMRIHPMSIDGTVTCFTPFHNINCPKGFLYFNNKGELRICVLPTHLSYDAPWPVRKVPLRCTPHNVVYHPESKTYTVVSSTSELCNRVVKLVGDGEKEFEMQEKDDRFVYPTLDKFSIQLFSPVSWEPIPNTKRDFDDFEHVTALQYVILKSEGTLSGLKGYVAIGTNYSYNEEVTSRGRLVIYDVIDVVPEPGQPLTKNKMKVEYDKEQKGPISAIEHVQGFLVTAMGQKIYIWQLKDQDLSGVAFIDTQVYVHSLCTIKNLILAADMLKSISLLRYQSEMKVLSLVSRDIKPLEVYSISYLVDNATLCFLVSDRYKNLLVYTYNPEVRESHGGQRLLRRADINIGSHVHTFFRIKCKLLDPSADRPLGGAIEKRHITYFATLDGSIGYLLPVTEKVFRRLSMVQNALTTHIAHVAGLNPKAYRLVHNEVRLLQNPHKNILDGDLIWKFLHLSMPERSELARRIGTSVEQIMDDLLEADRVTAHF